ncbi:putative arginyl-tRNA--protein transferase [Shewanella algicola]|uniref:Aspartate/glutamate leucyltransferase n=1 Tax=Shewanella algicola TaxID=640633 RepID=A0A9X1ZDT1_9GAMM|nr:arginyltransferase [Shewanella algicola]MCL1105268.1 arginyltransferase [Shewanella algicola]GGP50906.1 putative arginyl-tRNA--protein transferase [Shewanella algicola]
MNSKSVSVGISQPFDCNYIEGNKEQLLIIQEPHIDGALFEQLLGMGFRRNGNSIYKPRCPSCQACQSIRLNVHDFVLSKRQKRTLKNSQDLHWKVNYQTRPEHFELYQRYIKERHNDGPMYPASQTQYDDFLLSDWLPPMFIEVFDKDQLIGVAVTDNMVHSFSAIYSYFDPDYADRSLGSLMILIQCQLAKSMGKRYLYLGYQIDQNRKMRYKRQYRPYQILTPQGWQIGEQLEPLSC